MSMPGKDLLSNRCSLKAVAILVAVCTLLVVPANASDMIVQYEIDQDFDPAETEIYISIINNDEGAIYNSGTLNLFTPLADQLWIQPCNQANYASKTDMMNSWNLFISGRVSSGWAALVDIDANILIGHSDFRRYDIWYCTQNDPTQDMMDISISIPNSQLERIDTTNYLMPDKQIVLGASVMDWAFVANTGTPKSAYEYDVVNVSANGQVAITASRVPYLPPLVDFIATNNSTETLNALYLKADGVYEVRCDTAGWTVAIFGPADNIDVDGNGVYGRGVQLLPDSAGLTPGQSLQFRINSAYGNHLAASKALASLDDNGVVDCDSTVSDGSIVADIDADGYVDVNDLAVMAGQWLSIDANSSANLNDDSIVNLIDFAMLADNFGYSQENNADINWNSQDDLAAAGRLSQNAVVYGPSSNVLYITVTNNDGSAADNIIYDSGSLNVLKPLVSPLRALSCNQGYTSDAEMINDWGISILSNDSEVSKKWFTNFNSDGSSDVYHSGIGYDLWKSTQTDPSQDSMTYAVFIPNSQLELDGIAGYNPLTDARVKLGTKTLDDAFVGNTGTPKTAFEYKIAND